MAGFTQWHAIITSGKSQEEVTPHVVKWLNGFQESHGNPQKDYGLDEDGEIYQYLFAGLWNPSTKELSLVYSDKASEKLKLNGVDHHEMIKDKPSQESGNVETLKDIRLLVGGDIFNEISESHPPSIFRLLLGDDIEEVLEDYDEMNGSDLLADYLYEQLK